MIDNIEDHFREERDSDEAERDQEMKSE